MNGTAKAKENKCIFQPCFASLGYKLDEDKYVCWMHIQIAHKPEELVDIDKPVPLIPSEKI